MASARASSRGARASAAKAAQVRARIHARLQARRHEIEQATLARVYAVSDPSEAGDPEYVAGLRAAVAIAIEYGLSGVEHGEEGAAPEIPSALCAQARQAACNGVSLDTVLRRYFAGYTLLSDFLMQEAEDVDELDIEAAHRFGREQAAIFDRLVVAVTKEYREEEERGRHTSEHSRTKRVRRLLAGELLDAAALDYELDDWHLGAIAAGPGAPVALRDLAAALDRRLLVVRPDESSIWAWFGGRDRVEAEEVVRLSADGWPSEVSLAVGEPACGILGWRLTHQQALAAFPVASRASDGVARYADVALLASALRDDVLARSLEALYLDPLAQGKDDGASLRQTLEAYFSADRQVSSAAAALGVSRQTVNSRLRAIEAMIGRSLASCAVEIEIALRLRGLSGRQAH